MHECSRRSFESAFRLRRKPEVIITGHDIMSDEVFIILYIQKNVTQQVKIQRESFVKGDMLVWESIATTTFGFHVLTDPTDSWNLLVAWV